MNTFNVFYQVAVQSYEHNWEGLWGITTEKNCFGSLYLKARFGSPRGNQRAPVTGELTRRQLRREWIAARLITCQGCKRTCACYLSGMFNIRTCGNTQREISMLIEFWYKREDMRRTIEKNLVSVAAHKEIVSIDVARLSGPTLHTLHSHPRLLSLVPPDNKVCFPVQILKLLPISLSLHFVAATIYNHMSHLGNIFSQEHASFSSSQFSHQIWRDKGESFSYPKNVTS